MVPSDQMMRWATSACRVQDKHHMPITLVQASANIIAVINPWLTSMADDRALTTFRKVMKASDQFDQNEKIPTTKVRGRSLNVMT